LLPPSLDVCHALVAMFLVSFQAPAPPVEMFVASELVYQSLVAMEFVYIKFVDAPLVLRLSACSCVDDLSQPARMSTAVVKVTGTISVLFMYVVWFPLGWFIQAEEIYRQMRDDGLVFGLPHLVCLTANAITGSPMRRETAQ